MNPVKVISTEGCLNGKSILGFTVPRLTLRFRAKAGTDASSEDQETKVICNRSSCIYYVLSRYLPKRKHASNVLSKAVHLCRVQVSSQG